MLTMQNKWLVALIACWMIFIAVMGTAEMRKNAEVGDEVGENVGAEVEDQIEDIKDETLYQMLDRVKDMESQLNNMIEAPTAEDKLRLMNHYRDLSIEHLRSIPCTAQGPISDHQTFAYMDKYRQGSSAQAHRLQNYQKVSGYGSEPGYDEIYDEMFPCLALDRIDSRNVGRP